MKRLRWIVHAGGFWFRLGTKWRGLFLWYPFFRMPVIAGGSEGMPAQGTYIVMGDGASPETFTEIAEVTSIGGPGISVERLDFTHLRTVGNYRERKNSFVDPGEVTLRIQYNATAHPTHNASVGLPSKLNVADPTNFRLVFPDATSWDFAATVTGFELTGVEVGGKIEADVTLGLSGAVNFSGAGSPA